MTTSAAAAAWTLVDEGWGRRAADFATLSEPANCREYVALHHRLGVTDGNRLLDIACGAGLSTERARAAFVALRIAFSTVNDALGARPDAEYRSVAPPAVLEAITYGRPLAD